MSIRDMLALSLFRILVRQARARSKGIKLIPLPFLYLDKDINLERRIVSLF